MEIRLRLFSKGPQDRGMDSPGCCLPDSTTACLPLAHLPKSVAGGCLLVFARGLVSSRSLGKCWHLAGNLARGESWPQIPRRKKEVKGQAWSVREAEAEAEEGDPARQEWGQRDTGRKAHRKESWGVIRRKINLFMGAERVA